MIDKETFADEFADLALEAGIEETCALDFPEYMYERNQEDPRAFAEVDPHALYFAFAPQVLELPWQHRRGLIMHELGHYLCRDLPGGGTERDADLAAEECFGERIIYDHAWPGKGLQCVRCEPRENPLKISRSQIERAGQEGRKTFVYMPALDFLKLTATGPDMYPTIEDLRESALPLDDYNEWAREGKISVSPFLSLNATGRVVGHEGRHRAAALVNADGEKAKMLVSIRHAGKVPAFWKAEFQPGVSVYAGRYDRYTGRELLDALYPQEEPRENPPEKLTPTQQKALDRIRERARDYEGFPRFPVYPEQYGRVPTLEALKKKGYIDYETELHKGYEYVRDQARGTSWLEYFITRIEPSPQEEPRENPRLSAGMSPSDFDPVELERGTRVEMEHTDDPREAQRIAMDHLTERGDYYRILESLHLNPSVKDQDEELIRRAESLSTKFYEMLRAVEEIDDDEIYRKMSDHLETVLPDNIIPVYSRTPTGRLKKDSRKALERYVGVYWGMLDWLLSTGYPEWGDPDRVLVLFPEEFEKLGILSNSQVRAIAEQNLIAAIDQQHEYASLYDALESYADNAADTVRSEGGTHDQAMEAAYLVMKDAEEPTRNPPLPDPDIPARFMEHVATLSGIREERVREALDTIVSGYEQGEIANVQLKDAKDTLSRVVDSAWDAIRSKHLRGRGDAAWRLIWAINLMGLHDAIATKKKLARFAAKPDKPMDSSAGPETYADLDPNAIEILESMVNAAEPLALMVKEMKSMVVKGRPKSAGPTKAQISEMERRKDPRLKTCAWCFGEYITGKDGKPMRHGFSVITTGRGHGLQGAWHTGPCPGSGYLHYGLSPEGTEAALAAAGRALAETEAQIEHLERDRPPLTGKTGYGRQARDVIVSSGERSYEKLLERRVSELKTRRKALAESIPFYEEKVRTWKPEEPGPKKNPPFSGYDSDYPRKAKPKDPTKISYRRKRDALNVFLDWNAHVIDEAFSGPTARQPADSFDNFNHRYGLEGKRRVTTLAKALWLAMPAGSPYYLEDIDVEMLNETSPMRHNTRLSLSIPDYAEERRLLEKEQAYWEEKYGGVYPDEEEVPF